MCCPWSLYLAYKQLLPTGKRGSFFAWMGTIGVMLGVMVLIIVQCVMGGFGETIRQLVVETGGDIRIESRWLIEDDVSLYNKIKTVSGIKGVAPYAQGVVMLQYEDRPAFPLIKGIMPDFEKTVFPLERYVTSGDFNHLSDEGILLSVPLASALRIRIGESIWVYSPLMLEKLSENEVLLPKELTVVGFFETGWNQIDQNTVLVSLETMQALYGMENHIHGISIRLESADQEPIVLKKLRDLLPKDWQIYTVLEANHDLLFILRLEKTMLFFIILFVILVAAFSITSSLMTTVVKKTREIGLLCTMGATPNGIALCFCLQGLMIGVVGTFIGTLGALLALYFRNDIVQAFARLTHSEATLVKFYQFSQIPVNYAWEDFCLIIPLTILIATAAGLLPAWRVRKLGVAVALRYDN